MRKALALAALTMLVLTASAAAADAPLRLISEDETTVTFAYDQASDAEGYRYYAAGAAVARTFDPMRVTVRYAKGAASYRVGVLDLSERDGQLPTRVVSETAITVTLAYDPVAGATGYRYYDAQGPVARTFDPARATVRFWKASAPHRVVVLDAAERTDGFVYPPPVPPASECRVSNFQDWSYEDCEYGTLIERTNQAWSCDRPLSSYGPLPIKVVIRATGPYNAAAGVDLSTGCRGDSDLDTVDLIAIVEGDGARGTRGPQQDAFKTRGGIGGGSGGPVDVQVTGRFDCGPAGASAHQDMIQWQGGTNITVVNARSGDWEAGLATCQGAGGVIYTSAGTNNDLVGTFLVGCNKGIGGPGANETNDVRDGGSRSGRTDGTDPNCVGFAASNPCVPDPVYARMVCQRWIGGAWVNRPPS